MIEVGALIGRDGQVLYWHQPEGRSAAYIPDTRILWDQFVVHGAQVEGFAHTHPGGGIAFPSEEDYSTFFAIEQGLGRRFKWWVLSVEGAATTTERTTETDGYYTWDTMLIPANQEPIWAQEIRDRSKKET